MQVRGLPTQDVSDLYGAAFGASRMSKHDKLRTIGAGHPDGEDRSSSRWAAARSDWPTSGRHS